MAIPLLVLGVGALVVGFLGIPHVMRRSAGTISDLPELVGPLDGSSVAGHELPEDLFVDQSRVWPRPGCHGGRHRPRRRVVSQQEGMTSLAENKAPKRLYSFLFDKWRVDELYAATIVNPIRQVATVRRPRGPDVRRCAAHPASELQREPAREVSVPLAERCRPDVRDGARRSGSSRSWRCFGHRGPISTERSKGGTLQLIAAPGIGYEYRWDANSDGTFEGGWTTTRIHAPTYSADDVTEVVLYVRSPRTGVSKALLSRRPVVSSAASPKRSMRSGDEAEALSRSRRASTTCQVQLRLNGAKVFGQWRLTRRRGALHGSWHRNRERAHGAAFEGRGDRRGSKCVRQRRRRFTAK